LVYVAQFIVFIKPKPSTKLKNLMSEMTQSERLYNYTRQRAESKAFQILHNVSIVHALFPSNTRVYKTEKNSAAGRSLERVNDERNK